LKFSFSALNMYLLVFIISVIAWTKMVEKDEHELMVEDSFTIGPDYDFDDWSRD
jgi:hypothetical protein